MKDVTREAWRARRAWLAAKFGAISPNGWVAVVISVATLSVSVVSCRNASDNADMRAAVGSIAALAQETKRQADATTAQVALLRAQTENSARQTEAIVDQAAATRESSTAAIASAQAQSATAKSSLQALAPKASLNTVVVEGLDDAPDGAGKVMIWVGMNFSNDGGTAIKSGVSRVRGTIADQPPTSLTQGGPLRSMGGQLTVPPGNNWGAARALPFEADVATVKDLKSGAKHLYVYGVIQYFDLAGAEHLQCFGSRIQIDENLRTGLAPLDGAAFECRT